MDRTTLVAQYRALGFKVANTGFIQGYGTQYGYIGGTEVQLPDGNIHPISGIDHLSMDDADNAVTIHDTDGGETRYQGAPMTFDEIGVPTLRAMPKTTAELCDLFEELYPKVDGQLFYDELLERDMIDMAMLDRPSEGYRPINDKIMAVYHDNIERKLKGLGCNGNLPSNRVMDEVLSIQTFSRSRNFFREWIESHEWDGVPRVRTWFKDTFGATAPALDPEDEERYLGDVAEAWFVGAVRRQYRLTRHDIVPVLIGDQGIGKGLALRFTAGRDEWYIDTNTDVRDPQRFLDGVRGRIIVELSESTQMRNSDAELLKSFISKDKDQLRKAYARFDEPFPRHFVLIATSNLDNIFTDVTGNRRYFPMYCDPRRATRAFSTDRRVGQYDVEQVWAEALWILNHNGKWFMTRESRRIARKMQEFYAVENPGISLVSDWLNVHPQYSKVGARINRRKIFEECFGVDPDGLASREMESAFRAWTLGDRCWQKVASLRVDGKVCRGYERIYAANEDVEELGLNIVDSSAVVSDEDDPVMVMREVCAREHIGNDDDPFPADGIKPEIIDALMAEGYLYSPRLGEYRIGYLP